MGPRAMRLDGGDAASDSYCLSGRKYKSSTIFACLYASLIRDVQCQELDRACGRDEDEHEEASQ